MKKCNRTVNIVDDFTKVMIKHVINVELFMNSSMISSSFFTS